MLTVAFSNLKCVVCCVLFIEWCVRGCFGVCCVPICVCFVLRVVDVFEVVLCVVSCLLVVVRCEGEC